MFFIGTVTGYRFVIAENYSALLDPLAEVQTLVGFQQPDEAGASTSYQFGLARMDDHYNKDLFLGLLAFDEKDNEGSMSNIGKKKILGMGRARSSPSQAYVDRD